MLICLCLTGGVSSGRSENLSAKYYFKMCFYIIKKSAAASTSPAVSVSPRGAWTVIEVLSDTIAKPPLVSTGECYGGSVHHHACGSRRLQTYASSMIPTLVLAW